MRVRRYRDADVESVEHLYLQHRYVALRRPGDAARLYGMPGTTGFVLEDEAGRVRAYAFCGKGNDFTRYVLEWGGATELVADLVTHVAAAGAADHLLAPRGGEELVDRLVARGAAWFAQPAGCWCVIDPDRLDELGAGRGWSPAITVDRTDPTIWLGTVDPAGRCAPGPLEIAVWGFDSV
jgi:hypothetical protein